MIVLQVTEEVKCLVVNPNHMVVVSGQGPAPHQVSDSISFATLHTLGLGQFSRAPAVFTFYG